VVTFNNIIANVSFAGLTGTGLYQINVTVPAGLPDGDAKGGGDRGGESLTPVGSVVTIKN